MNKQALNSQLELYIGPNCSLCEQAKELIYLSLPHGSYQLQLVDLTQASLELKKAYGLRIPVLRNTANEAELGWPFDARQLSEFVSGGCR